MIWFLDFVKIVIKDINLILQNYVLKKLLKLLVIHFALNGITKFVQNALLAHTLDLMENVLYQIQFVNLLIL
jgi:hypothetical protein